jgi:fatty acid desaturase
MASFSIQQAKRIVADLFEPRPAVYWVDLLLSVGIGYGAGLVFLIWPPFSWLGTLGFVVAGFALYRAGVFMHELVHLPKQRMRGFRIAWNLLYGVPMLMPSFMYSSHLDHHNWRHFGTSRDGEYLPLGARPIGHLLLYLAQVPLLPALAIIRFLLLTPLSLLVPGLRRPILERFSSFVINPAYRRPLPAHEKRTAWAVMEVGCFAVLAGLAGLTIGGVLPWQTLVQLYCLGTFAAGINWVRTLAAHRYRNDGAEMTYVDQLTDSVNIVGQPTVTELCFPIGLKYHALHHLFPALPYHALGEAHRRLMAQLPADSPYRQTVSSSFWRVFVELFHSAQAQGRASPMKSAV